MRIRFQSNKNYRGEKIVEWLIKRKGRREEGRRPDKYSCRAGNAFEGKRAEQIIAKSLYLNK